MILSSDTVVFFLCQYNLLDWQTISSAKVVKYDGRNNTFGIESGNTKILVKQPIVSLSSQEEGLYHEVTFYNWFKKQSYESNFILPCVGYEPINQVLILPYIVDASTTSSQSLTNSQMHTICKAVFSFHHITSLPNVPTILMDKPNLWKFLNETNNRTDSSVLNKEWLDVVKRIKQSCILKEAFNQLTDYWVPTHICNADIKFENFLLDKTTQEIYWIDWERFCIADELWDIACVLRMIFLEYLNQYKNLHTVLDNAQFKKKMSIIWNTTLRHIPEVSKEKLLLLWVVSILDKSLESIQAETMNHSVAQFILSICELMFLNSLKIYSLFC